MKSRNLRKPKFKPFSPTYGAIAGLPKKAAKGKSAPKKRRRRDTLAGPYLPISEGLYTLSPAGNEWPVVVPDSMDSETNSALHKLRDALGGDVSQFVQQRLGYRTHEAMAAALVAEQVDAVALAIYNIEVRGEGLIIADQTGIGKGRIAAALIRYGTQQGLFPIFLSERPNLFTDIYRDLKDIGSADLVPFIVNARESKSDVKAGDGTILYQAPSPADQRGLISLVGAEDNGGESGRRVRSLGRSKDGPYACVLATYSQFNRGFNWLGDGSKQRRGGKKVVDRSFSGLNPKCKFLANLASGNLIILDESHNASGASNTGEYMAQVLARAKGVAFLSATFAKRPDNMVVYAKKTVLNEAGLEDDALVSAINKGGVALQEIISSQLVSSGQLLRRERPYAGVEVNWRTLTAEAPVHRSRSDEMMAILRDVIEFQHNHVDPYLKAMNDQMADSQAGKTKGTGEAGISNTPMFSRVFNMIFQMLFGIKAEAVANHAVDRLRSGKKVLITFQSTMGAFLEGLQGDDEDGEGAGDENGMEMKVDTRVKATFDIVLERVLNLALAITIKAANGTSTKKFIPVDDLSPAAQADYSSLMLRIKNVTTDVNISPIDLVTKIIKQAGFGVAEVTGRGLFLDLSEDNRTGYVRRRQRENTSDAFRRFNNNEVDCLLLNAAGSTGASAHAVATPKVPAAQVKQRVMIIHQPSLDINTEVQKRGRVFRTGQILPPIYDYLTSAIPAEQRLMMMLQRKLKSLDANTTSNQKNSSALVDGELADFLNHHGDRIVAEYLLENPKLNRKLGDPLKNCDFSSANEDGSDAELKTVPADFALKVTGRVAVLPCSTQSEFYTEVSIRYKDHIAYLDNTGQNDLEVKDLDLRAVVSDRSPALAGQGGRSQFGGSVFRETAEVRNLTKPMSPLEVVGLVRETLNGRTAEQAQQELSDQVTEFFRIREDGLLADFDWEKAIQKELVRQKTPKSLQKDNPTAYAELVTMIRNDLQTGLDEDTKRVRTDRGAMLSFVRQYKIGYGYKVPNPDLSAHDQRDANHFIPAVFLGFQLDEKRRNPYAKSAVKMQFALASPHRSLTLPASSPLGKTAFYAANIQYKPWNGPLSEGTWNFLIQKENGDTEKRMILTGNVLLALGSPEFKEFRLPLVSFTMADGTVRKGIFMPREYNKFVQNAARGGYGFISQGLRSKGLATRLAEIFIAAQKAYNPIMLQMRAGGGGVTLKVRTSPDYVSFDLWLGWEDKEFQNEGKAFVKNFPLLEALGVRYELTQTTRNDSQSDKRYWSRNVPVERLERVLKVLGEQSVVVALTERMLESYPDLLPENRNYDTETWPIPPNLLPARKVKPTVPVSKPPQPPQPAEPNRRLALARARVKVAAAALELEETTALAGVRSRRSRKAAIGHPKVRSYVR